MRASSKKGGALGGSLCLDSHAKLNLTLNVFPKLESGLHPIHSIFQEISLHDTVDICYTKSNSPSLTLISEGICMPTDNTNIYSKIFLHFKDKLTHDYTLTTTKRIPLGSGMGGASTNAASFLKALIKIEGWNWTETDFINASTQFGSDIAFFIRGGSQLISGVGQVLSSTTVSPPSHYIIIHPHIHCSTKEVYDTFDTLYKPSQTLPSPSSDIGYNDLFLPVMTRYPEMKDIHDSLSTLLRSPVYLTGSGSTFFICLTDTLHAKPLIDKLKDHYPHFFVEIVSAIL
ncbi:hypothetical protein DID78_02155 [Candidatus Marinamargulisbacteria bacterium SCGC AG-343-D04]|nr:hypothetical protein DID78_02155 [Candidatus Marinamargulisbacteria bacterium SCGC AG-343-D04]